MGWDHLGAGKCECPNSEKVKVEAGDTVGALFIK